MTLIHWLWSNGGGKKRGHDGGVWRGPGGGKRSHAVQPPAKFLFFSPCGHALIYLHIANIRVGISLIMIS